MSLSHKSKDYFKAFCKLRTPYRSWKSHRKYQTRNMLGWDSITNYIPLEGIMSATYKFIHGLDHTKDVEMVVPDVLDMTEVINNYVQNGYFVEGPEILTTDRGTLLVEHKFQDTLACKCGDILELVSIEDGYSCSNKDCDLHI